MTPSLVDPRPQIPGPVVSDDPGPGSRRTRPVSPAGSRSLPPVSGVRAPGTDGTRDIHEGGRVQGTSTPEVPTGPSRPTSTLRLPSGGPVASGPVSGLLLRPFGPRPPGGPARPSHPTELPGPLGWSHWLTGRTSTVRTCGRATCSWRRGHGSSGSATSRRWSASRPTWGWTRLGRSSRTGSRTRGRVSGGVSGRASTRSDFVCV